MATTLSISPSAPPRLSRGERRTLQMLADGLSYRDIAAELGILEAPIKTRMWTIRTKMGCDTTCMAVAAGFRRGLLR